MSPSWWRDGVNIMRGNSFLWHSVSGISSRDRRRHFVPRESIVGTTNEHRKPHVVLLTLYDWFSHKHPSHCNTPPPHPRSADNQIYRPWKGKRHVVTRPII